MGLDDDCDRLFAEFDRAYRSGHAEHAAALVTHDAIISPIDLPDIAGRDTIETVLKQFFASAQVHEYRLTAREIEIAHVRGVFTWRCTMSDGRAMNSDGRYAAVLHHTDRGWRLHRLIENRLPPP